VTEVTLYARPGCHLCEVARESILSLRDEGYELTLREVDIEGDDVLLRRHLERIPVVEADGEVVSELIFDPAALRGRLDTVQAVRAEEEATG